MLRMLDRLVSSHPNNSASTLLRLDKDKCSCLFCPTATDEDKNFTKFAPDQHRAEGGQAEAGAAEDRRGEGEDEKAPGGDGAREEKEGGGGAEVEGP